ncbi:MAG: hypothetical protein HQK84_09495 [Nitrospinae bacterium]|nr:hypothetical protein [Nitrospinota bacterium]
MNFAHFHLIVNHIPLIGLLFAFITFLYSLIKKSEEVRKVALILFIIAGISSIPTYFSGGEAEEIVEHLAGVTEHMIEEHEEAAEVAFVLTLITAGIAVGGLLLTQFSKQITIALVISSIVSFAFMSNAAKLGGEIRHQETRDKFSVPKASHLGENKEHHEKDDDD